MYRLFYNYDISGDILFILIDPEKKNGSIKEDGDVTAIYDEEGKLIGVNIFEFSNYAKLKANGVIFAPNPKLIETVNGILKSKGLPELPVLDYSLFEVAKIIKTEEHPLNEKESIVYLEANGDEFETVSSLNGLDDGKLVVIAKDGSILSDGSTFHKDIVKNIRVDVKILSEDDLRLGEDKKNAFEPRGYEEGDDFFLASR